MADSRPTWERQAHQFVWTRVFMWSLTLRTGLVPVNPLFSTAETELLLV